MAIDSAAKKTASASQGPSKSEPPSKSQPGNKFPPKPDERAHRRALDDIKSRIDDLQDKLRRVNEKINDTAGSPDGQKRSELKDELDKLREKQADNKKSRGQSIDRLKMLQDSVGKKRRELKSGKDRIQFKTVKDIDQYIAQLEREIESGELKLAEEKRRINDITNLKRSKKQVEQFEAQQIAIDEEMREIESIRKTLDESDVKETNSKYESVKAQLDDLDKSRQGLYDERRLIKNQISSEIDRRHQQQDMFSKQNREFTEWLDENRRVKAQLDKKRQEEQEAADREELAKQKLEEAAIPAFHNEIVVCESLIKYFRADAKSEQPAAPVAVSENLRQPDTTSHAEGTTILVKKSDRDEDFFAGSRSTGKNKKGGRKQKTPKATERVHFDVSVISHLDSVGVKAPSTQGEVEQTLIALEEKKKYYRENQDRVTKENIEKVKAEIDTWNLKTPQDENGESTKTPGSAPAPAPAAVVVESKDEGKE